MSETMIDVYSTYGVVLKCCTPTVCFMCFVSSLFAFSDVYTENAKPQTHFSSHLYIQITKLNRRRKSLLTIPTQV